MGKRATFGVSGWGNWFTSIPAVAIPLGFPEGGWGEARPSDSRRGDGARCDLRRFRMGELVHVHPRKCNPDWIPGGLQDQGMRSPLLELQGGRSGEECLPYLPVAERFCRDWVWRMSSASQR